jgi:hypothetical protein
MIKNILKGAYLGAVLAVSAVLLAACVSPDQVAQAPSSAAAAQQNDNLAQPFTVWQS